MTIDERARHELFTQAEAAMGAGPAETLMALLPPVGWADVATKHDLERELAQLELRLDQRFELSEHRILGTVKRELTAEIGTVRGEIAAEIGTLRGEIGTVRGEIGTQTRTLFFAMTGVMLVV